MKWLLILLLFITLTFQELVRPREHLCKCAQVLTMDECIRNPQCVWTSTSNDRGVCSQAAASRPIPGSYCSQFSASTCQKTTGCAYIQGACTHFAGCTAYALKTNLDCQAASWLCISNGQHCVPAKKCQEYTTQAECWNPSISGNLQCKWENEQCRDSVCSEADPNYKSDETCSKWLKGCLWNGKSCVPELPLCTFYNPPCDNLIGKDGKCIASSSDSSCRAITCGDAPQTTTTDLDCNSYLSGCLTKGRGCIKGPVLPVCSEYQGTSDDCLALVGKDGACEGGLASGKCKARECASAPKTAKSNEDCNKYKAGCVWIGNGCANSRQSCNSYQGTSEVCALLIGNEGRCVGGQNGRCAPIDCAKIANPKSETDCSNVVSECVFNGESCIRRQSRLNCDMYNGDSEKCFKMIGNDGKCMRAENTVGPCKARRCSDVYYTSTKLCSEFQSNCISDGSICIENQTCPNRLTQTSCIGSSNCGWDAQCMSITRCSNFKTASICLNNGSVDQQGIKQICQWEESTSSCRNRQCTDAPLSFRTDAQCEEFLKDCMSNNGQGCISATTPCSQLRGNQRICQTYKRKCSNEASADNNQPCQERLCHHMVSAKTNYECSQFFESCVTNGNGCIHRDRPCSEYKGTQSQCMQFAGSGGRDLCWNTNSANNETPCLVKSCSLIANPQNSGDCQSFLPFCIHNGGSVCVDQRTALCSSYEGNRQSCLEITTPEGRCYGTETKSQCFKLTCRNIRLEGKQLCADFDCVSLGNNQCIEKSAACSEISLSTAEQCGNVLGASVRCTKEYFCDDNNCNLLVAPKSNQDCLGFMSNCRYSNGRCIQSTECGSVVSNSLSVCSETYDASNNRCWYTTGSFCTRRACNQVLSPTLQADCDNFMSGCIYDGKACVERTAACNLFNARGSLLTEKQQFCASLPSNSCIFIDGAVNCLQRLCQHKTDATSGAECENFLKGCTYIGSPTCVAATSCASYFPGANLLTNCLQAKDSTGNGCTYQSGTTCAARSCSNAQQKSSVECPLWIKDCQYDGSQCVATSSCDQYFAIGSTEELRRMNCSSLKNNTGSGCALGLAGRCGNRTCDNVYNPRGILDCTSWAPDCQWNGARCYIMLGTCAGYAAVGNNSSEKHLFCSSVMSKEGLKCKWDGAGSQCTDDACKMLIDPAGEKDCQAFSPACTMVTYFSKNVCMEKNLTCEKAMPLNWEDCYNLNVIRSDLKCAPNLTLGASLATASRPCKARQCSDNFWAQTDEDCNLFLSGCKTNGNGCIPQGTPCRSISVANSICSKIKNADGTGFCRALNIVPGNCVDSKCGDKASALSDFECRQHNPLCGFLDGKCVQMRRQTIPNEIPYCSLFSGDNDRCQKFGCWNLEGSTRDRTCLAKECKLNTKAKDNLDCQLWNQNCIFGGNGCIPRNSVCSSFTGNRQGCSQFTGSDGLCWNTEAAAVTSKCELKRCTHNITATNDFECESFLPRGPTSTTPRCVTIGQGCIAYPAKCDDFVANRLQCSQFTAIDGPCDQVKTSGPPRCQPKQCQDAPQSYSTDEQCRSFHKRCVTTGRGCIDFTSCQEMTERTTCVSRAGCNWVHSCINRIDECSQLNSASACLSRKLVDTQGKEKRCGWLNGLCKPYSCEHAPENYSTDAQCKTIHLSCVTIGRGCVQISNCAAYNQALCELAQSLDPSKRCFWDQVSGCRPVDCSHAKLDVATNQGCARFWSGCVTNGIRCVTPATITDCSKLLSKSACFSDNQARPCLWFNNKCISYAKCEDVKLATLEECQQLSNSCTSDGESCIPISPCAMYTKQASCRKGLEGVCGWVPDSVPTKSYCRTYLSCSDVAYETTADCLKYNENCVSNGVKCVQKKPCADYADVVSCQSGGSDGPCFFAQPKCRLRECGDATLVDVLNMTSHVGCNAFKAKTLCTTNGEKCIPIMRCNQYTRINQCYTGTDGICIWDQEKCRIKVCTDFTFYTLKECQAVLPIKQYISGCVSDGQRCVPLGFCSTYTSRQACRAGGFDGSCVFTPTTSYNVGSCKLMESCFDASNDQEACNQMQDVCYWKTSANGQSLLTGCYPHDCESLGSAFGCRPVPNFDKTLFSFCQLKNGRCTSVEGSELGHNECYASSVGTYFFNPAANKCQACFTRDEDGVRIEIPKERGNSTESMYSMNLAWPALVGAIFLIQNY